MTSRASTNAAHPLPKGCNINVRGIAPGASLIGMKVFGNANSAYNSVILQGLDYALSNDHPDVISESFGGYPIPDTTEDLTRQFNEQAVAAGVTVVESSGDSGVRSSPNSASSDPSVISAGASTTFRNYAQGTQYAYQFAHGWLNDQSPRSSRPGSRWAGACSTSSRRAKRTGRSAAQTPPFTRNARTSPASRRRSRASAARASRRRSSPAERRSSSRPTGTATGARRRPRRSSRHLLTSTATDLHVPTVEQGAGEMNTLAAVQAAKSLGGTPVGQNLLVGPTQLDLSGQNGTSAQRSVKVTNLGAATQIVHAHVRAITQTLSNQSGTVTLDPGSPRFVDQFGVARPYEKVTFSVPSGTDRLDSFEAWTGPQARVDETLIDPSGKMAAVQRAQGDGNHGEVDVHDPTPGTWTAIVFQRDGTFTGPVHWQVLAQKFGGVDSVSPSAVTLGPGQTRSLQVEVTFGNAGDASHDLELDSSNGQTTVVPIAIRSLVSLSGRGGSFTGDLIGGNGRNGAGQPGQIDTYDFNVPAGQAELSVGVTFANDPGTPVYGALIDPSGNEVTGDTNAQTDASGVKTFTNGLETYVPSPRPGRWRFVVDVQNPVGGNVLSAPYRGQIGFAPPVVRAPKLPNSASTQLPAGKPATFAVTVRNAGVGTQNVFLDPRTAGRQYFSLLSLTPDANVALPVPSNALPPLYLVPTETNSVDAFAQASEPVTFDFGWATRTSRR